jgi:integrase
VNTGIDPSILAMIPANPIPWPQFRAEVLAAWSGPPICSRHHAYITAKSIEEVELLDLAGPGEPRRTIETTADLTVGLIAKYVATRPAGWSPHTLKTRLSSLRIACNFAERQRWLMISPFRLVQMAKLVRIPAPSGKRCLTAAETRKLLDLMRRDIEEKRGWAQWRARRLFGLTATVALTALRAREAQCLWVEDFDLANRVINLVPRGPRVPVEGEPAARLKTPGSAQPVAMPRVLVPIIESWWEHRLDHPDGFPMPPADRVPFAFPGTTRVSAWVGGSAGTKPVDRLKALGERAGIGLVTFQMLRRGWATRAEALGIPDPLASRQCRHSSIETTKRWYAARDMAALRDAVEGFDF